MRIQQKDSAKKIAGIIFILASVLTAASYYGVTMGLFSKPFMYTTFNPAGIYGFIGIAIALFLEKRMIAAAFSMVSFIHSILAVVKEMNMYKQYKITMGADSYLMFAGVLIMFVFLALAMFLPKLGYKFGLVSIGGAALTVVHRIIKIVQYIGDAKISAAYGNKVSYISIPNITALLLSVAIMFALWNLLIVFAEDRPVKKAAHQPAAQATLVDESTAVAEKLLQLKELLDLGVITQDEFDSKKKELF